MAIPNTSKARGVTSASALISAAQDGTRASIGQLAENNPDLLALVTKLIPGRQTPTHDSKGNRKITTPRIDNLAEVSQSISRKKRDARAIMEIFPDVRLAAEIWIVSVISPNDMFTEELLYSVPNNLYCRPLTTGLISIAREYFEKNYDLLDKFYDILRETAFGAGSYPIMVLPESSLDELIHGSPAEVSKKLSTATERHALLGKVLNSDDTIRSLGYLGRGSTMRPSDNKFKFGMESYNVSEGTVSHNVNIIHENVSMKVAVHDNPEIIKLGIVREKLAEHAKAKISNKIYGNSFGLENGEINDAKLGALLYSTGRSRSETMLRVKSTAETARDTIGPALLLDLPPESVIPIVALSNPKKPLAYYVLIDSIGYPVRNNDAVDNFEQMRLSAMKADNADLNSFLLNKARTAFGQSCVDPTMAQAAQIYGEIIDADILSRARTGILGAEVTVANTEEAYRVMLARGLQGHMTQMLFVPEEMITYFSYDVNEDGTGRSLIEGIRSTAAARAQLRYARLIGATKNSIGRKRATVNIDEEDFDRVATLEMISAEILAAGAANTTANSLIPRDIVSMLGSAAIEIELAGNGPVPGTKIEFTEVQSNYQKPDAELEEEYADAMISGVEVPPEMVEDAKRMEFATIAANNNVLFAKRVRKNQSRYEKQLAHHTRAVLRSDGVILDKMRAYIKENLKLVTEDKNTPEDIKNVKDEKLLVKLLLSEFISNFEVGLNKPDVKSRQTQSEAMSQFVNDLDAALDNMIGDDALDAAIVGEGVAGQLGVFKQMARSAILRREMARTNFMPEVLDLFTKNSDGVRTDDITPESTEFITTLTTGLRELLKAVAKIRQAGEIEIGNIPTGGEVDNAASGSSFGDSTSSGEGGSSNELDDLSDPNSSSSELGNDDLNDIPPM